MIAAVGGELIRRSSRRLASAPVSGTTLSGSGTAYTLDFGARHSRRDGRFVLTECATLSLVGLQDSYRDWRRSGFCAQGGEPDRYVGRVFRNDHRPSGFDGPLAPVTITLHSLVAAAPALRIKPSGADVVVSWPVAEQDWVLRALDGPGELDRYGSSRRSIPPRSTP